MDISSTSFVIFIIFTILYFILLYFLDAKLHGAINIIYFLFVITSQLLLIYQQTKQVCKTPQLGTTLIWGLIPWFFIFFGLIVALNVFPGWKAPFSNTFGYLIVKLLGVKTIFNNLLKTKFNTSDYTLNKVIEQIYEDQSLLINEFTPLNFDTAISKLKPLFDLKNQNYELNVNALRKMVLLKDEISRFIWYILTGGLVISLSNMGVLTSKCEKNISHMEEEQRKYKEALEKNKELEKEASKQRSYVVRD
jgi:hypothetical protein